LIIKGFFHVYTSVFPIVLIITVFILKYAI